jgi:hypothetical protein
LLLTGVSSSLGSHAAVNLQEEHHTTIAAGQHLQHGPELEPIDPSYVGRSNSVLVSKTKGDKKPLDAKDLM